jgi:hypothetical protein
VPLPGFASRTEGQGPPFKKGNKDLGFFFLPMSPGLFQAEQFNFQVQAQVAKLCIIKI